jgi:hypothetical protein
MTVALDPANAAGLIFYHIAMGSSPRQFGRPVAVALRTPQASQ